ncbi:hypothetical protein A3K64_01590 [Candidatus Micrarchaeota archaeon RBG_16_36_9]|nr:MAG: hypothetical protein A3K64_01590 [Candidatus Micrarchaeota archaeon RBG_16_36_9]
MRKIIIFILIAIASFSVFTVLSYFDQTFLGVILALILLCWPIIFWLMSKLLENHPFEKKNDNLIGQDIIEGTEEKIETSSEGFETSHKRDDNLIKAKAELEKLKKSLEFLDEEKRDGILTDDIYNELKKQYEEPIEKLEEEIAKSSGKVEDKKVYCKKGKHYISIDDCLPSKINGYVICQEHNEEIRIE